MCEIEKKEIVLLLRCSFTAQLGSAQRLGDIHVCLFVEQEDEEANTGSHLKLIVDAFIQQLPNCVNRDLIDKVRTFQ